MENTMVNALKIPAPTVSTTTIFGLVAAIILGTNAYFLWKPRTDQVSGDTLIHLVFARNFLEGRPFEFNDGHPSRALTSPLWNWTLAAAGALTGTGQDPEGFLMVFRLLTVGTLLLALWSAWRLSGHLAGGALWSAASVLILATNPCLFYWTACNPMETAGTCLVVLLLLHWVRRASIDNSALLWFFGGFLAAAGFLVRPELIVFGSLAGTAAYVCSSQKRFPAVAMFALGLGLGVGLWSLCMIWSGLSVLPNAGSARRLMLLLHDASPMPLLGWPWSPDSLMFLCLFLPFLIGVISGLGSRDPGGRAVCLAVLMITAFSGLFFSFYFPTTWQGRYLLPTVFALVPVGSARLGILLPPVCRPAIVAAISFYSILVALILLRPLAAYADAPRQRSLPEPEFVEVPRDAHTLLCQEIQSAWFHPRLFHVCTEGLIGLEALEARRRDLSVIEFIREQQPDLIGTGRYPLRDPEGVAAAIETAAEKKKNVVLPGVELTYLGELPGCGSVFRPRWGPTPNPPSH